MIVAQEVRAERKHTRLPGSLACGVGPADEAEATESKPDTPEDGPYAGANQLLQAVTEMGIQVTEVESPSESGSSVYSERAGAAGGAVADSERSSSSRPSSSGASSPGSQAGGAAAPSAAASAAGSPASAPTKQAGSVPSPRADAEGEAGAPRSGRRQVVLTESATLLLDPMARLKRPVKQLALSESATLVFGPAEGEAESEPAGPLLLPPPDLCEESPYSPVMSEDEGEGGEAARTDSEEADEAARQVRLASHALFDACLRGDAERAERWLAAGASPEASPTSESHFGALHVACMEGHVDCVRVLLRCSPTFEPSPSPPYPLRCPPAPADAPLAVRAGRARRPTRLRSTR